MFFLLLMSQVSAFVADGRIPTIMIAQRTVSSPMGPHPVDPLFIEKLFRERALPIMIRASLEQKPMYQAEKNTDEHRERIYRNRRSIADRVNDTSESRGVDNISPRRITFGLLSSERPKSHNEPDKNIVKPDEKRHPYLRFFFFVLAILVATIVGYQCGKVHESRNYVRVPSGN